MTKDPIYECQQCGATLERKEQGIYTHCRACRLFWDSAFMMGFQHARDLLSASSIVEMKNIMDDVAPYRVRP